MKLKQLIKGAFIGTLLIFLWNSTEWFNPLMKSPYKQVTDPIQYNSLLEEQMPENGIYAWHSNFANERGITKAKDVFYFTAKANGAYYDPGKFIRIELMTQFCIWFLMTYLLLSLGKKSYWKHIQFIMVFGLITILSFLLPMWNWWAFSSEFVVVRAVQMLLGWFLAGTAVYFAIWPKKHRSQKISVQHNVPNYS